MRFFDGRSGFSLAALVAGIIGGTMAMHNDGDTLVKYLKPRDQVAYFEIYHIDELTQHRSRISLEGLLRMQPDDYVRIGHSNVRTITELYEALSAKPLPTNEDCADAEPDTRWAVVLSYRDATKDAIGFGTTFPCVRVLSEPQVVSASPKLLSFLRHNFPFMR